MIQKNEMTSACLATYSLPSTVASNAMNAMKVARITLASLPTIITKSTVTPPAKNTRTKSGRKVNTKSIAVISIAILNPESTMM